MVKNKKIFKARVLLAALLSIIITNTCARNLYVNNLSGADTNAGLTSEKAFRTIAKAISVIRPGDTLHLANTGTPYKESLILYNINGTAQERIVIDGHGSTLSGSQPLDLSQWEEVSPGLYKNSTFYRANRFVPDFMRIYYFLFDGQICRMGRSRKGPSTPFKKPGELKENEWTFTDTDSSLYIKINPAKKLTDCNIEQPVRSNAVGVSGNTSYITVKNLVCTNVFNDGFGLTGNNHHLVLENIQSHYCGDDGISAHASSQFDVYGFVSIGNATGIADTGNSFTTYDGVIIMDCIGTDLMFINEKSGEAAHSLKNVVVIGNAFTPFVMNTLKPDGHMEMNFENVIFIGHNNKNKDSLIQSTGGTEFNSKNCSFVNLNFSLKGKAANMANTIIAGSGNFIAADNTWKATSNIYTGGLTIGNTTYSPQTKNIAAYRSKTKDKTSVWSAEAFKYIPQTKENVTAGADINKMPLLNEILKKYFDQVISAAKKNN